MAAFLVIALIGAPGYWWYTRPPGRYVTDNGGLFPIDENGKVGFMNASGETVIQPQFEEVGGFSEGLSTVRVGSKYGYIDDNGTMVITPQFDAATSFRFGRAAVKLCCGSGFQSGGNNRFGYIDTAGKYIGTPDLLWVSTLGFNGGLTPVQVADRGLGFLDRSGELKHAGKFDTLNIYGFVEGVAPAATGGKWGFIDAAGEWVINPQFESTLGFSDGLAPVTVGGRTGYIDHSGAFAINPQYQTAGWFVDGLAVVTMTDGGIAVIDKSGKVIVAPGTYSNIDGFSEGFAAVRLGDKSGFVDEEGRLVIAADYDYAFAFQNGLARVAALGKIGYINKSGTFVVNPFPGTTLKAERERIANEARLSAEKAERDRQAAEAARVASEAKAADERTQAVLQFPKYIVGTWRWSDTTTEYQSDGTIEGVNNAGLRFVNHWQIDGDTLIVRAISRLGRPVNQTEQRWVIDHIDESTFGLRTERGQLVEAQRVK
ncbi:MAG: WG repeat-containing protein [Cyanobacteria bacterium]|nr:WG repeat-containing protein [Cyanobacteriota bacterium]